MKVHIPRVMLAATSSGSGKTMVTCGTLQALINKGLNPVSFKCGPDYIDPMFHGRVMGVSSKNLDTFFTEDNVTRYLLGKEAGKAGIAVLEGVMGFYDGLGGVNTKASSYDLARVTDTPVVLIIDAKGMSLSVVAEIEGFKNFMPDSNIAGVILNRMSPMILKRLQPEIENRIGVKVLGCVPVADEFAVESRHLGLITPAEIKDIKERINGFADVIAENIFLDKLIDIAKSAPDLEYEVPDIPKLPEGTKLRIGITHDNAFCFNYRDNVELIEDMGAEVVFFSPLNDRRLPDDLDGMILYGGYPEVYAKDLCDNSSMRNFIKSAINDGMPYLAECGGFMYLHSEMEDMKGVKYPMVGVIEGDAFMTGGLKRFGYINLTSDGKDVFGNKEMFCKGHEFHYFDSSSNGDGLKATKPLSSRSWQCCHVTEDSVAGFPHFYYYSNPDYIYSFLMRCADKKRK